MIAVALSPKARALILAHRDPRRPTAADRERVTAALRAQLGATVLPLDTVASNPLMSTGIQRRFAAAFGLCVVGSGLFLAVRPQTALESTAQRPDQSVEATPTATLLPNASASLEIPVAPEQEIAPLTPQRARPKLSPAAPVADTLAAELALLTSAASQLSSGQASGALLALDEHQRRFSHGVLSNERNVARARALCMLHRFDQGRAALTRLATGTPAAARAKEECDSALARSDAANLAHKAESD